MSPLAKLHLFSQGLSKNRLYFKSMLFLVAWIFLIPTAIGYHFNANAGLINGILVDYRIPMLAPSFICFLLLLITFKKHDPKLLVIWATRALIFTLLFQTGLALFQTFAQRSLLSYFPLGEINFNSPQISKGISFTGVIYKLPYGSTSHPNVLAGFLVISLILILTQSQLPLKKSLKIFLFLCALTVCLLTQSISALVALLMGASIILIRHKTIDKFIKIFLISIPITTVCMLAAPTLTTNPNESIARRAILEQIGLKMIVDHPLTGVGWNNFLFLQEKYGYVAGTIRFIQPIHHVFLLLIVEFGLLGWLINLIIIAVICRVSPRYLPILSCLVILASFDHYLYTLNTGRMLILLVLFYIFLDQKTKRIIVI